MSLPSLYRPHAEQPWLYRWVTMPLSFVYRMLNELRNYAYHHRLLKAAALPGTTISVGNLCVGGSGKTPVTIGLAKLLTEACGAHPVILTRGYGSNLGRHDHACLLQGQLIASKLEPKRTRQGLVGADEARLASQQLPRVPVVLGRRRSEAAAWFLQTSSKISKATTHWLLEDGFQHRRLVRQVDIVLLPQDDPFGNHWLLPKGSLRERPEALMRADLILITRSQAGEANQALKEQVRRYTQAPIFDVPFISAPLQELRDGRLIPAAVEAVPKGVVVVSGIARPERFLRDLALQGVEIAQSHSLRDHEMISAARLRALTEGFPASVITAKDYWRQAEVFASLPAPVFVSDTLPLLPESELLRFLSQGSS